MIISCSFPNGVQRYANENDSGKTLTLNDAEVIAVVMQAGNGSLMLSGSEHFWHTVGLSRTKA